MSRIWEFFNFPSSEISPERETEIIEKMARTILKWRLEDPAILVLYSFRPMSTFFSQTALISLAPLLEFIGIKGYEYTAFFSKKENVKRIIDKVEELRNLGP